MSSSSSSSSMRKIVVVLTTYLVLQLQLLATTIPGVQGQEAPPVGFDEAACLQCVGDNLADNWIENVVTTNNATTTTNNNNEQESGVYCEQSYGEYDCLVDPAATCPGQTYAVSSSCIVDLNDAVDAVTKIAGGILTAFIIGSCCCCAIVVAAIAACVYCCVKGSQPLPAGVPGAYQTNPALQQPATTATMVLPGTVQQMTTTTIPAQTGLATAYQPAYQPQYVADSNGPPQNDATAIPFAQALSMNADGTIKK